MTPFHQGWQDREPDGRAKGLSLCCLHGALSLTQEQETSSLPPCCVPLGESLSLSGPQGSHLRALLTALSVGRRTNIVRSLQPGTWLLGR